jgi:hypothetical protein
MEVARKTAKYVQRVHGIQFGSIYSAVKVTTMGRWDIADYIYDRMIFLYTRN